MSEYLNYDDWGEFWASYAPQPGMTMYYVRYTHSPYRCLVTTDSRVGAIWRPHFAFFGYEAAKFSVRASHDGGRYIVALPGLMEDWPLCFEFVAFTQPLPGASKINVLERHDPQLRHKICAGKTAIRAGWKLQFSFFALDVPVPGTTKFSVQQCRDPFDQCRVWRHMPMPPWLQAMYFYAFNP